MQKFSINVRSEKSPQNFSLFGVFGENFSFIIFQRKSESKIHSKEFSVSYYLHMLKRSLLLLTVLNRGVSKNIIYVVV